MRGFILYFTECKRFTFSSRIRAAPGSPWPCHEQTSRVSRRQQWQQWHWHTVWSCYYTRRYTKRSPARFRKRVSWNSRWQSLAQQFRRRTRCVVRTSRRRDTVCPTKIVTTDFHVRVSFYRCISPCFSDDKRDIKAICYCVIVNYCLDKCCGGRTRVTGPSFAYGAFSSFLEMWWKRVS